MLLTWTAGTKLQHALKLGLGRRNKSVEDSGDRFQQTEVEFLPYERSKCRHFVAFDMWKRYRQKSPAGSANGFQNS